MHPDGGLQCGLSTDVVQSFFKQSELSPKKNNSENYWQNLCIKDNQLIIRPSIKIDSYLAADVAELLRQHLLTAGISFTFETVMSHPSKISFLKKALEEDYRVYLYYIATDDPEININRVNVRVAQQGHNVAPEVIRKRYYKSLKNLKVAVMQTSRT